MALYEVLILIASGGQFGSACAELGGFPGFSSRQREIRQPSESPQVPGFPLENAFVSVPLTLEVASPGSEPGLQRKHFVRCDRILGKPAEGAFDLGFILHRERPLENASPHGRIVRTAVQTGV